MRNGTLTRARRGVYVEGVPPDDPFGNHLLRLTAALHLAGERVVASHWSAAALWGLPIPTKMIRTVWLTSPGVGGGYLRNGVRRCRGELSADDVAQVERVRCTSLARTVTDLARMTTFEQGVMLADAALRQGLKRAALADRIAAAAGWTGVARARAVAEFADGRAESPMESVTRVAISRVGVPMPELQRNIYDANGNWLARVDFCWDDVGLIGEYDGVDKYSMDSDQPASAVIAEKARDAKLRDAGWMVVHWTKADLADRDAFGHRLRQSRATAGRLMDTRRRLMDTRGVAGLSSPRPRTP